MATLIEISAGSSPSSQWRRHMKVAPDLHLRDARSIGLLPPSRLRVSTRAYVTALSSQLSRAWGRPESVTPCRRQVGGHITRWLSLSDRGTQGEPARTP